VGRPLKWAVDLHPIRERVLRAKTETWTRRDIENLFEVKRVTAQTLMLAIAEVSIVAGSHLVSRSSLLDFLNQVIQADEPSEALRARQAEAPTAPRQERGLRIPLPDDLRAVRFGDLPMAIRVEPGRLTIEGANAAEILTHLAVLARALENDLDSFCASWDPPARPLPKGSSDLDGLFRQRCW